MIQKMAPKIASDADGDIPPCSVMDSYAAAKCWDDWKQAKYGGAQKARPAVERFKEMWMKKAVQVTIQLKSSFTASECIWAIDSDAPVPCPLEGGDGGGPMYLCIIGEDIVRLLYSGKNMLKFKVYSGPSEPFWMKGRYYMNMYHVRWRVDGVAGVAVDALTDDVIDILREVNHKDADMPLASVPPVPIVQQTSCFPCSWFLRKWRRPVHEAV
jgi:hypothetical protein